MQDYESEDQQIEALKKWWAENSRSLVIGVVVGLGAIFGWREYSDHVTGQGQLASDLYNVIANQVQAGSLTDINKYEQLQTEFSKTPYATLAALAVASYHSDKGDLDQAAEHLQWAESNTQIEETRHIARLRLATIHLAKQDLEAARQLLEQDHPQAFALHYEELKGDLYAAQGDKQKAIEAYDRAIGLQDNPGNPMLQLKRKSLGG